MEFKAETQPRNAAFRLPKRPPVKRRGLDCGSPAGCTLGSLKAAFLPSGVADAPALSGIHDDII